MAEQGSSRKDLDKEIAMTIITEPEAAASEPQAPSIYEAIGGRPSVKAAVDGLYMRLFADPELSRYFPAGVSDRHRAYVVTLVGEALGGPERYRGPDLAAAHRHLRISNAHFDRTAAHLDTVLDGLGVPRELIDQIIGIVASLRPHIVTA
jgi:hemoglobin